MAHTPAVNCQHAQGGVARNDQLEPHGLVKQRRQFDREAGVVRAPDSVDITRLHVEAISAGMEVGVQRGTLRAAVNPIVVVAFKFVAEPDFLRRDETQRSVLKREFAVAAAHFGGGGGAGRLDAIYNYFLDRNRWW